MILENASSILDETIRGVFNFIWPECPDTVTLRVLDGAGCGGWCGKAWHTGLVEIRVVGGKCFPKNFQRTKKHKEEGYIDAGWVLDEKELLAYLIGHECQHLTQFSTWPEMQSWYSNADKDAVSAVLCATMEREADVRGIEWMRAWRRAHRVEPNLYMLPLA